jgi:hypothetical protein
MRPLRGEVRYLTVRKQSQSWQSVTPGLELGGFRRFNLPRRVLLASAIDTNCLEDYAHASIRMQAVLSDPRRLVGRDICENEIDRSGGVAGHCDRHRRDHQ